MKIQIPGIRLKFALIGALLLWSLTVRASDHKNSERTYNAPLEKVWTVSVQTAKEKWKVTHTDQANGVLKFRQGISFKTNTWGMIVCVTVSKVDENHTKVALTFQKFDPLELSWTRRDIENRFFGELDNSFVDSGTTTGNPSPPSSGDDQ